MVRTYGQMPRQLFRSLHPMVLQSLTVKSANHSVVNFIFYSRDSSLGFRFSYYVQRNIVSKCGLQPPVLASVQGLLWGSYVGSPADAEPILVAKHQHRTLVADLVPLHSNDVFGLAPHTSILLCYSKEKGQ